MVDVPLEVAKEIEEVTVATEDFFQGTTEAQVLAPNTLEGQVETVTNRVMNPASLVDRLCACGPGSRREREDKECANGGRDPVEGCDVLDRHCLDYLAHAGRPHPPCVRRRNGVAA